ncbi:MAG: hypothetical protein R3A51_14445, partial [Nannocystaceae bacterium]
MDDPQALSRALDERRDDVELSPLTLTFRDPALERAYWEHFFDENRRALIIAYLIVVVFAVAFTPVEYALFPARYPSLWAVRFGVILPGLAAFAPVLFSPRVIARVSRRYIQELMVAGTMIVLVGLGLQSVIALDVLTESIVLYGGLVYFLLLMGVHCVLRLRFLYAGALGTFILAAGLA